MRLALWLVVLLAASASVASAQPITQYRLNIYLQGGANPVTSATLPATSFTCGQPTVPVTGTQANPTRVRIADPANPTANDCVYVDTGTGPLLALPFNPTAIYESTIAATNSVGTSPESTRSNLFTRPGTVPSAPTRLRVGG